MAQTIKLKRSAVAGRIPSTSDLDLGEIGINTVDGKAYIKKSVSGVESVVQLGSAAAAADAIMVEYQFTATNNQTSFSGGDDNSVQLGYTSGAVQVFLNGVLLDNGIDYTANNSVSVVLAEAATTGDFLQVIAFKKKIGEGNVSVATLSGNGTATAYTLPLDPDNENNTRVFIDGVYQSKSNYSVSGTTLTFSTAPPNGTAIEVEISGRSVTLDTAATIDLPDNTKLTAGDAGDLEIFHDASNSYVKDVGTGNLKISSNNQVDITKGTSETMATFVVDGAVTLYHDNAAKIATSATGVTITGAAAATTFSGDLSGTINTATTATTQSAGNNSTKVATTAYVDVAIAALGDSAPSTLNTLNELAAALGDDANFAATTATALGLRVSKTADTGAAVIPVGTTAQRPTAAAGQFRYNSTLGKFEGYTDAWGEIGGGGAASFAADNFTGDGSTTAYALTTPAASEDNLLVFIEGVFQQQNAFSIATSSGTTTLTFSAAPANGNSIIIYRLSPAVNGTNLTSNTMTGDGSDTTLTLSAAPVNENNTQVFVNGVYQNKSTYSISGTTLTFSEAPPTGALVECMTMNQLDVNVPVDDSITSAKLSGNLTTPGTLAVTGGITATTTDNSSNLTLVSTDADSSAGPVLEFFRNSASPADNDATGLIYFYGENDASEKIAYGQVFTQIKDMTDGTEDGSVEFYTMTAGTSTSKLLLNPTETVFNEGSTDLDFRVESDNSTHALFVEGSSGNVGIGTSSPSTKLHLGGTAPLDSIIRQDSTVSGTNWEIGERAAGKWQIWEDDSDSVVATFMSSGNVGIGTDSPTRLFHVKRSDSGGTVAKFENSAGTVYIELNTDNQSGADAGYLSYDSNQNLGLWTDDTQRMTITSDGRIGFGEGAGNVGHRDVEGKMDLRMDMAGVDWTENDWASVWDSAGTPGANFNKAVLHLDTNRFGGATGGIVGIAFSPGWQGHQNWGIYSHNRSGGSRSEGDLSFVNQLNAGNIQERMRLTASGNVGIGTSSPTDLLSVGTLGSTASPVLTIGSATNTSGQIYFGDGAGAARYRGYIEYNHSADYMVFGTSATERLRISADGIVTTPHQPAFATTGANYTQGSSWTKIIPNSRTFDIGNNYSNGVFTAPVSGVYEFAFWGLIYPITTATTVFSIAYYKNNALVAQVVQGSGPNSLHSDVAGSVLLQLALGDAIELRLNTTQGNAYSSQWNMSGKLIG